MGLTEFVDPAGDFSVGYPSDWQQLTEDELLDQLDIADQPAAGAALANISAVFVTPDRLALFSITKIPLLADGRSLEEIAEAVQDANAASVQGIADVEAQSIDLDGVDAVRLSYTAADPASGEAGTRSVQQVVSVSDEIVVILAFVAPSDDVSDVEADFRRIEESWRWRP